MTILPTPLFKMKLPPMRFRMTSFPSTICQMALLSALTYQNDNPIGDFLVNDIQPENTFSNTFFSTSLSPNAKLANTIFIT
jgi:hypothetical protein